MNRRSSKEQHNEPSIACDSGSTKIVEPAEPEVWISQWDMAVTQFAFLGMMLLHSDVLGCAHLSYQDKEAITHCWRCIGYQLGMDDRYNLFSSGDVHEIERLCWSLEGEVFRPSLASNSPDGIRMGMTILNSIRNIIHGLTYHGFMKFWSEVVGVRYLVRLSSGDWLSYVLISGVFRSRMLSVASVRRGFSRLLLWAIGRASKRRRVMAIYKELCVRDNRASAIATAPVGCPFATRRTASQQSYQRIDHNQLL